MNWIQKLESTDRGKELMAYEKMHSALTEYFSGIMNSYSSEEVFYKKIGKSKKWVKKFLSGEKDIKLKTLIKIFHRIGYNIQFSFTIR